MAQSFGLTPRAGVAYKGDTASLQASDRVK